MAIEESVRKRLDGLIAESAKLARGNEHGQTVDQARVAACSAWLTMAQNAVHLVVAQADAPYRTKVDRIAERSQGHLIHKAVAELAQVLQAMVRDADAGLLASVADQARAEAFDDFLDHADWYREAGRKNEAGVIAGVVFEDSLRRICRKIGIAEKGQKLDALISELATRGDLTPVKAKRARAAADVRTKATHAQWDEFELADVKATVEFTRELIESRLT